MHQRSAETSHEPDSDAGIANMLERLVKKPAQTTLNRRIAMTRERLQWRARYVILGGQSLEAKISRRRQPLAANSLASSENTNCPVYVPCPGASTHSSLPLATSQIRNPTELNLRIPSDWTLQKMTCGDFITSRS